MSAQDVLRVVGFTIAVATASTLLILPFGTAVAWLLAQRRPRRGRVLLEALMDLPLVLPPTATGLLLLVTLSPRGPAGALLARFGVEVAFTAKAVVIACAVMALPLLVRGARTAFEGVDPRLVAMARTLGCSRAGAFWRVELPLAGRGLLAGSLLAFARALGEFGATVMVAGNIPGETQTLALLLFQRVQVGREDQALVLAGVAAAIAFGVLLLVDLLRRRQLARERDGG